MIWRATPTLKELGHGMAAQSCCSLCGPQGVSPAVVRRLHDAFRTALFDPAQVAKLGK